jgi:hypothetical protein
MGLGDRWEPRGYQRHVEATVEFGRIAIEFTAIGAPDQHRALRALPAGVAGSQ